MTHGDICYFFLHDGLNQLQYTTIATHTLTKAALWMVFYVVFWFCFFRLNVLTIFPVSFLATRTTKGMFTLSFVDRCHLCPCFRLEFTCPFSEPDGNQEPMVLSPQIWHFHLSCCFEQHCCFQLAPSTDITCSYVPAKKKGACIPERLYLSNLQLDWLMLVYSF